VAAGLEAGAQGLEVAAPVFAAHGLEHLDGDDGVEGRPRAARQVAVVLVAQLHLPAQAQGLHARLAPLQLLARQGHAGDVGAELAGGDLGQPAPAAADLQHPGAGCHPASRRARRTLACWAA
jgi:hypothetical protein